ncbi:hypothetical protein HON71_04795 [Candidatus Woesearchaeota archaeon]|jgi:hypothetical protein|nr:hypothetical protein [Candidatus Woesearchaeota archaeon]MBT6774768.1 hypothetical protein [Candidatus Woesearchaeota archaeon]
MNKKGAIQIVALVLALIILAYLLITFAQRECNSNRDCPGNAYCGTDYECHEFPDQIIVKQTNYISSAAILGIFLVMAAYIFKTGKVPFYKEIKNKIKKLKED